MFSVHCSVLSVQWYYWSVEYNLFINAVQSTDFPNLTRCDVCVTMSSKQTMLDIFANINFGWIIMYVLPYVFDKIE